MAGQFAMAGEDSGKEDTWVIVHAGTLLAVPGQPPEKEKTIVIRNGVIEEVLDGYVSAPTAEAVDAKVISLKDRFVLPGLMDMHVHLTIGRQTMMGMPDDAGSTVIVIHNAQTALMTGITTVRDAGSYGPAVFKVRDGINKGLIHGPRIYLSGEFLRVTGGHGSYPGQAAKPHPLCDGTDACRWLTREQIRRGADFIKLMVSDGGSGERGGPDDLPEIFDDEIKAVVDTAHRMKRIVSVHAHGTASINAALRNGVDSVEHSTFLDEESIRLYKKTGAIMVPTLAFIAPRGNDENRESQAYLESMSPSQKIRARQFRERQPKGVAMAYKAGVVIAAGSDAGVGPIAHGLSVLEPIAYVDMAGMTTMDAIKTATVNGAKLLRKEDVLGTLEPGKYADLVATDTSPLEDIHVLKQIPFVMKDGVVYKDERK
jgi:imidazolonepropionase-like amidohydrolase